MVKQSAVNLDITPNATGYTIAGGTTQRALTIAGASASVTLTSQALTGNLTLPNSAATSLLAQSDFAAKGNLLSASAANTLSVLPVGTDGQFLSASSAAASGLAWVANSSFAWTDVTGTSQALVADNGYVADNAGLVTLTLPATAAFGTIISVVGSGTGGWLVAQNASQSIRFGTITSTVGAGGSLASTNSRDSISMLCVVANTTWTVMNNVGNITIV